MTKDVLVSVHGLQKSEGENQDIKLVAPGKYYKKNEKHYILYDEYTEDDNELIRNTIQFNDNYLSITKRGAVDATMVIEPGRANLTQYQTAFGMFQISVHGKKIQVDEDMDSIHIRAKYGLTINYEEMGESQVLIDITSKGVGEEFSLA